MRYALEKWDQIARDLRSAAAIVLFLDFDGTLVRLRERPEDVVLDRATRLALLRLAHLPRLHISIISGRRQADLRERVPVHGVTYLGLHGWDASGNGKLAEDVRLLLNEAKRILTERLYGVGGIRIEDKGATFAVHYRGVDVTFVQDARICLHGLLGESAGGLRVIEGDQVWEVLPRDIGGKAAAARKNLLAFGGNALPIYIGNDATDEPAFQALSRGVTIRVGRKRSSCAKFQLRDPEEVRVFLQKLEYEIR